MLSLLNNNSFNKKHSCQRSYYCYSYTEALYQTHWKSGLKVKKLST